MNLILAIILGIILYTNLTISLIWVILVVLVSWKTLNKVKSKIIKIITVLIISFIIIFIQQQHNYTSLSPLKTYDILSVGSEHINKVAFYKVNDFHYEMLKNEYHDETTIIEYANKSNAYKALESGEVDHLVIESKQTDSSKKTKIIKVITPQEAAAPIKDPSHEPVLIFVSGLDSGEEALVRSRSDMNLLIAMNPMTHKVTSVSIARDTYVPLACRDNKMDKLTHAGLYGLECQIQTLENLIGLEVDLYLRTHFAGFQRIVDSLEGVDVEIQENFGDFSIGQEHMNGKRALEFVRARYDVSNGDVGRGENAQRVVEAILKKAQINMSLQTVLELSNIIDTNVNPRDVVRLLNNKRAFSIERHVLLGKGDMQETFSQNDGYKYYVSWPDQNSLNDIKNTLELTLKGE